MNQRIFILFSLYKQSDKTKPINWATAVFSTRELAEKKKRSIEDTRKDIEECFIQENVLQTA
jgi:hypothetical protein